MPPPGRYRLAIETSNPSAAEPGAPGAGVAIGLDAAVLGEEAVQSGRDDDLMPAIDRLTRRLGLAPRDLGTVAVSVGPGGYTGLRTAVAVTKMLCEATGAGCVAVPTALVAAGALAETRVPVLRFAVALASKGDSAFLTLFEDGRAAGPGALAGAGDLAAMRPGALLADRFLPVPMRDEAARLGVVIRPLVLSAPARFQASLSLAPIDPLALAPLYPREAEAVTQWRRRHP